MAVDERRRKALHDALERAIGAEQAATMMELVPRGDPSELATRRDLELALAATESRLEARIESVRGDLRAEMQSLNRRTIQWTSGAVFAAATLAFTAARIA